MPEFKVKYKVVKEYTIPDGTVADAAAAKAEYEANPGTYAGSEVVKKDKVASICWTDNDGFNIERY